MKKLIALLLIALAVTALAACGKNREKPADPTAGTKDHPTDEPMTAPTDEPEDAERLVGGWTLSDSPEVSDAVRTVLEKAVVSIDDVGLEPVAYVASQVVAGTNHLILCKAKYASSATRAVNYALVTVYVDLQGNAGITSIADSGVSAVYTNNADGGWAETDSPAITDSVIAAYDVTDENGVSYRPLSLLATQVVAGINYRCLCRVVSDGQKDAPDYVIAEAYRSLEGDSAVTSVHDFGTN